MKSKEKKENTFTRKQKWKSTTRENSEKYTKLVKPNQKTMAGLCKCVTEPKEEGETWK